MFLSTWAQVARGKTPMRACMNYALSRYTLAPEVLDLGGGKNPSYRDYFKNGREVTISNFDQQHGEPIDFEKDRLPYADGSIEQVLMLNALEHVYNHRFFVAEAHRVLREGGEVIGFVPFLINYHADPHDYFRYTDEALMKIFRDAGFREIKIETIGLGPSMVNTNTFASFMPALLNAFAYPFAYLSDELLLAMKPSFKQRFPLGYLFVLHK